RFGDIAVIPNTQPGPYYDHVYGIEGVRGRNTSYWLKNKSSGVFEDVGNIIVIENTEGQLGVELALGDTTLVKQINGLDHVQDSYRINVAGDEAPEPIRRKLEDAVITSLALYREGLRPSAKNNQTRILRSYLKATSLYRRLLGIECDVLKSRISNIESGSLPFDANGQGDQIVQWISEYEETIRLKGPSNKEDNAIQRILKDQVLVKN
ncbi:MAG: hypothetical protein AAB914_02830, partial [Patescibacteria group bacterium]